MIQVKNLTIEYSRLLFNDLSFILGNKEKVGLIGLNGCGKSTLLKIIMGEEKPDRGEVIIQNEHIEYLPQIFTLSSQERVGVRWAEDATKDSPTFVGEYLESLVNYDISEMWKVNSILTRLDLGELDEFQDVETLSPGQKMKLYLAKLLINKPTILLLDEPTNHLDIAGITWFEKFVKKFDGICIIISHDREFLNNTVNKIFEIDEQKLYVYEGNYDDYLVHKEEFKEKRAVQFLLQERKRQQLETLVENARKITNGEKRGRAIRAAKKRMEREVESVAINKYVEKKIKNLKIEGEVHKTKMILKIENVAFDYRLKGDDDHRRPQHDYCPPQHDQHHPQLLLKNVDFQMFGNEKVWLLGQNGIGKTTFIKLITGELKPNSGIIQIGENLSWTYFSQVGAADLQNGSSNHDSVGASDLLQLQNYFIRQTGIGFNESFGLLEKFLFTKDMFKMQIHKLSPGQKARLTFAIFAQKKYDFLILDEPTNHLDIGTKEVIEESLREFKGAILLISHDRYFVKNVGVSRVITIKDGKIVEI